MKLKNSLILGLAFSVGAALSASIAHSDGARAVQKGQIKATLKPAIGAKPPVCGTGFNVANKKLDTSATPVWAHDCVDTKVVTLKCNSGLNMLPLKIETVPITPVEGGTQTVKIKMKYTCYPPQG
ncbi:MAG: hypothetical protein MI743_22110 [Sneathiellales bacterium]|nr:hypothetical protein [Sneathiellales bacterium]